MEYRSASASCFFQEKPDCALQKPHIPAALQQRGERVGRALRKAMCYWLQEFCWQYLSGLRKDGSAKIEDVRLPGKIVRVRIVSVERQRQLILPQSH